MILAYDGNMIVIDEAKKEANSVFLGDLPMTKLKFLSETMILTTGHKYSPSMIGFDKSAGKWYANLIFGPKYYYFFRVKVDDLLPKADERKASSSAFGSAFAKFKSMDDCGMKAEKDPTTISLKIGHVNTIR